MNIDGAYLPSRLSGFFPGVPGPRMNGQSRLERHLAGYESSSTVMSSELETTSFCDSEDDDTMSRWEVDQWTKEESLKFLLSHQSRVK